MKVTVYVESGQYCTDGFAKEVETIGTKLALKRLINKFANENEVLYDNWGGFHKARTCVFMGNLEEFENRYTEITAPHFITGVTRRIGVFEDANEEGIITN